MYKFSSNCSYLLIILLGLLFHFTEKVVGQDFHKIDSLITLQIDQQNIAGGVGYIYHNGRVVYKKAFGFQDRLGNIPMQTNSIFRIASQTKAIVSIAMLQLIEQGKCKLDDPIEKFFPAFENQKVLIKENGIDKLVKRKRSITILDLLSHQSGISSADEYPQYRKIFQLYGLINTYNFTFKSLQEEVDSIAKMPLMHQPGERFSYGYSTDVLGALIELLSGTSLDKYLYTNICKPLKMRDTYFYLPAKKANRLVKVYIKMANNQLQEVSIDQYPVNYPLSENKTYFSAIGGLVSTVDDYGKFLQCLLNNGVYGNAKKLIGDRWLQIFWTNQLGEKTFIFGGIPSVNNFGLGVGLTTQLGTKINGATIGSFFWGGAFNTSYLVDYNRKLITLFYFQRIPFVLPPVLSLLEKTAEESIANIEKQ